MFTQTSCWFLLGTIGSLSFFEQTEWCPEEEPIDHTGLNQVSWRRLPSSQKQGSVADLSASKVQQQKQDQYHCKRQPFLCHMLAAVNVFAASNLSKTSGFSSFRITRKHWDHPTLQTSVPSLLEAHLTEQRNNDQYGTSIQVSGKLDRSNWPHWPPGLSSSLHKPQTLKCKTRFMHFSERVHFGLISKANAKTTLKQIWGKSTCVDNRLLKWQKNKQKRRGFIYFRRCCSWTWLKVRVVLLSSLLLRAVSKTAEVTQVNATLVNRKLTWLFQVRVVLYVSVNWHLITLLWLSSLFLFSLYFLPIASLCNIH